MCYGIPHIPTPTRQTNALACKSMYPFLPAKRAPSNPKIPDPAMQDLVS